MSISASVLRARIENAAECIGPLWPLQTFNSANPLSGFESLPFDQAVRQAGRRLGGRGYPSPAAFRNALEAGAIDRERLQARLREHGVSDSVEATLRRMKPRSSAPTDRSGSAQLNRLVTKWLSAFLDQGQAPWPMPNRADGFYAAWRILAPFDREIPGVRQAADLPATLVDAFADALDGIPESTWEDVFEHHLAALPGWVGVIRWHERLPPRDRLTDSPITLGNYLAVRLTLARLLDQPLLPDSETSSASTSDDDAALPSLWLSAWEETYREDLLSDIHDAVATPGSSNALSCVDGPVNGRDGSTGETPGLGRPDAQFVFCIDVRSEVIRRHLEAVGAYETHGYAGFFGIPMEHQAYGEDHGVKSCPPIVDPRHRIADRVAPSQADDAERYDEWGRTENARRSLIHTLKNDVAAAFGFVEGSGGFFGAAMAVRTLLPDRVFHWLRAVESRIPGPDRFTEPALDDVSGDANGAASSDPSAHRSTGDGDRLPPGLTPQARIVYAEAAFRLMGWTEGFAPVVVFTGHGSQTPNNPYKSSLDCGACAGNPGDPNARVLATLCNDPDVRDALAERGIDIPEDTVFLAGFHNTTTDEISLYVDETSPPVDPSALNAIRADLHEARRRATAERVETLDDQVMSSPTREMERRAADWSETRPEWGLAGNAAFIIAPRALTRSLNLKGRCFLHSYDWRTDDEGTALETIMTGPLVVGEWINMQYYFSTVDNEAYGSGSKTTHNVVGKIGIVQGNGGDLQTGLPLQSLHLDDDRAYHAPLRLMAVIHAPVDRVDTIVRRQPTLARLFNHEWVALTVIDPEQDHALHRYQPGGSWTRAADPAPAGV